MSREVKLEKECFIGNITEIASLLLDALRGGTDVVVDCGDVERIDTAAIQLFLAARKEAEALGTSLRFVPSATVQEFVSRNGMSLQ